ncbi:MAG: ABC transporter ATP-binding protein [Clostridia bacterium]|nr:ABC transporter ATP-binding protein [Clostridia bacterium]
MKAKTPLKRAERSTLKRVLGYAFKYPFSVCGSLIFAFASVVCTLFVPVLIGDAIDCIVGQGAVDFETLKTLFFKVIAFAVSAAIAQWITGVCNNRLCCNVVRDIRADAFRKIMRLPVAYLDKHAHGDTVSRVVADADQFADGLLLGFSQFFVGITTIIGTIAFMLMTSWIIGLVVVLVTPLSLFVARFVATHTHRFFKTQTEVRGEQTAFTEERISGLKTVQAFSQEDESLEVFEEINERLEKASMNAVFYSSLTNPSTRFINNFVYALVALIGGFSVLAGGGFTVGDLTKFLAYANQYTKPFNEISGVITELKGAFTCAARIFELIDETEEVPDEENEELSSVQGAVELCSVDFSYEKDKKLIENLSLKVEKGKRVAIVGKTGSGKTTLVNLFMRFYDTDGGEVKIDGKNVKSLTRKSVRKSFGMVLQETWIKSGTVKENIKMGNESATDEEVVAAAKAAHAHGFIKRLENGYDTPLKEDGGSLSEGQKQLLCIARIMLALPPMLILDEATSSIDTRTELKISDAFTALTKDRTSFIVAHRLSTVENADVILVMEKGAVVEKGTHKELIEKRGAYFELYNSQFR